MEKVDSKTISPKLEEKEGNDENSISCLIDIDLSGEDSLKNGIIDLDFKGNDRDIKKKCNSILQVRDLDTSEVSVSKVKCA
jgi:hypothetical protein